VEENPPRHSGSWDPFPSKQGNSGGDRLWKDGALAAPFAILALLMYPSYLCANLTRAAPPKRKRARGLTRELPRMAVPVLYLYCTCPSVPLPGDPLLRYALVPAFRPGGGVAGPLSPLGKYRSSATVLSTTLRPHQHYHGGRRSCNTAGKIEVVGRDMRSSAPTTLFQSARPP
jgi:hypothetical protein